MPIQPSPSVERALAILDFLADRPGETFSLSQLAREVGMPRATCDAVVQALTQRGCVIRHEPDLTYGLGPALIVYGEAARDGIPVLAIASRELDVLATSLRLSAVAAMRAGNEMLVAAVVNHDQPLGVTLRPGQSMPLVPPFGAAFMAWADDAEVDAWLDRAAELRPRERARYRAALAVVRDRGYSVTVNIGLREQPSPDLFRRRERLIRALVHTEYLPAELDPTRAHRITQLSAPVFDHRGQVVLTLLLVGPPYELAPAQIAELGEELRDAAQRVSGRITGAIPIVS